MNSSTGSSTMPASAPAPTKTATKRVAKKTVDETVAPVPTAAVVAPVAAAAPATPVVEKKAKKVAKAAAVPVAPVVAPTVTDSTAAAAPVVDAPTQTVGDEIRTMVSALTTMRETISTLHNQLKKLEKRVAREVKDARKRKRRAPQLDANGEVKPPRLSIFEIPAKISDDLCAFLGKPNGSEMTRSNVTKAVTTYIKEKGLKGKHDIQPDAALKKLLAPPKDTTLTYFNLQTYLSKHYLKTAKVVPPAVPAAH